MAGVYGFGSVSIGGVEVCSGDVELVRKPEYYNFKYFNSTTQELTTSPKMSLVKVVHTVNYILEDYSPNLLNQLLASPNTTVDFNVYNVSDSSVTNYSANAVVVAVGAIEVGQPLTVQFEILGAG